MELNSSSKNDDDDDDEPRPASRPHSESSESSSQGTEREALGSSFPASLPAPVVHSEPSTTTDTEQENPTSDNNDVPPSAPAAQVFTTSGTPEVELAQLHGDNDAPVPPAYIAAEWEEMEKTFQSSIEYNQDDGPGPPMPPAYAAAAALEGKENADEAKKKPDIIEADEPIRYAHQISALLEGEKDEAKGIIEKNKGALDGNVDSMPKNPLYEEQSNTAPQASAESHSSDATPREIGQSQFNTGLLPTVNPVIRPPPSSMLPRTSNGETSALSSQGGVALDIAQIDDNNAPPVLQSAAAYEEMLRTAKMRLDIAQIDDNNAPPVLQNAAAHEEMLRTAKMRTEILPMMPPVPPAVLIALAEEIDESIENARKTKKKPEIIEEDDDSHPDSPVQENPSHNVQQTHTAPQPSTDSHSSDAITPRAIGQSPLYTSHQQTFLNRVIRPPRPPMLPSSTDERSALSNVPLFHEVEATAVPNEPVYDGVLVQPDPWWKQHQKYIMLGVGLVVVSLVVAVGVSLDSNNSTKNEDESNESAVRVDLSSMHPSLSPSPSQVPPSSTPSSSTHPSTSTHPTPLCFSGEVNIFTDQYPEDTDWKLSRITVVDSFPNTEVVHQGSPEDKATQYTKKMCLEMGEYEFIIFDSEGDGICCGSGDGHYNLLVDGVVIASRWGNFRLKQTVPFSVGFAPSIQPSTSPAPSDVPPSFQPSVTSRPSQTPSLRPSLKPSTSLVPTTYWSTLTWKQDGQTIAGDSSGDWSGRSTALSSDGKTLAIGASGAEGNDDRPGYVKVYHREDNVSSWELVETFLGEAHGDLFGYSVSFSKDGKALAIGAQGFWEKVDRPGYVRVYYVEDGGTGSSWGKLGQTIFGEALGDESGRSVSLSSNGRTLAIGAHVNSGNGEYSGHARVYHLDDEDTEPSWQQVGQDIDGEASGDLSGWSVSLSGDGKTLAIGATGNDGNGNNAGHVRVYYLYDNEVPIWKQLGQDIDGDSEGDRSAIRGDKSGWSVSLSNDGKTVAIGAPANGGNGYNAGHVRAYYLADNDEPSWQKVGQDIEGEAAEDQFGVCVSLSGDGKTLAIGANTNDGNGYNSGHVRVYYLEGDGPESSWQQVGQAIDGEAVGDNSGASVAVSEDGKTVVIGSHVNDDNGDKSGHVRVFNIEY